MCCRYKRSLFSYQQSLKGSFCSIIHKCLYNFTLAQAETFREHDTSRCKDQDFLWVEFHVRLRREQPAVVKCGDLVNYARTGWSTRHKWQKKKKLELTVAVIITALWRDPHTDLISDWRWWWYKKKTSPLQIGDQSQRGIDYICFMVHLRLNTSRTLTVPCLQLKSVRSSVHSALQIKTSGLNTYVLCMNAKYAKMQCAIHAQKSGQENRVWNHGQFTPSTNTMLVTNFGNGGRR